MYIHLIDVVLRSIAVHFPEIRGVIVGALLNFDVLYTIIWDSFRRSLKSTDLIVETTAAIGGSESSVIEPVNQVRGESFT